MVWIKSDELSKFGGLVHGFSDRHLDDDLDQVAKNFGLSTIFTLTQVHSADVFVVRDGFKNHIERKGDAIVSGISSMGIGVFSADCVPILFADRKASSVGVAHAGWRGTLSRIAGNTIRKMVIGFGVNPGDVFVVIGPSIGKCCYEVGKDVASLFMDKFRDCNRYLSREGISHYMLDLKEANRLALLEEGVKDVEVLNICTKCNRHFHSYRREGKKTGTQISLIGMV